MDETARNLISQLMARARAEGLPEEAEDDSWKRSKFPCERCHSTAWIDVVKDGRVYKMRCPDCRLARDQARYLEESGITPTDYAKYRLDNFKVTDMATARMMREARAYLADPSKSIGYFGKPGTGKTHICIAICQALGKEHHYWQYRREVQRLKGVMYKDIDRYEALIRKAAEAPYLYIDDLFKGAWAGDQLSSQDDQIMFDIINTRYIKKLPTIVSGEYGISAISKADEAIGSRLYEMMAPHIVDVVGGNRRFA